MDLGNIGKTSDDPGQVEIAPLVDIVFLLLLFFMMTTTFRVDQGFEVTLPEAQASQKKQSDVEPVTVKVGADGLIRIGETSVGTVEAMRPLVANQSEVSLQADKSARYDDVVRAMDWLKQAGVKDVLLSTDAPKVQPVPQ